MRGVDASVTTTANTAAESDIIRIRQLTLASGSSSASLDLVVDLDLDIRAGERIGLVGESGSGKSMLAAAIMRTLPRGVRVVGGTIEIAGQDVLRLGERGLRTIRGRVVSSVPQNAHSSLNPVIPVGRQVADVAKAHLKLDRDEAMRRAIALLDAMGLPDAEGRVRDYPHQFSGGMAQRIAIATALICGPRVIIADEPTTGLDPTIQRQVLETMDLSVRESGSALLLISHDLAAVAGMTDTVVVLYAGVVLEQGPTQSVIERPLSPYSAGLVAASRTDGDEISFIPGRIPMPGTVPRDSCPFAARCPLVSQRCYKERPRLQRAHDGRLVACHNVNLQS